MRRSSASRTLRPIDSAAVVELDAQAPLAQALLHRGAVLVEAIRDRQHDRLHGRQPQRQLARVVLDQDADEALEGAQQRAMDHHRPVLGVVRAGVGSSKRSGIE